MYAFLEQHMIIFPIILPLLTGAILLLLDERRQNLKSIIGLVSCGFQLIIAIILLLHLNSTTSSLETYHLGNWPPPFGIILVLDRFSSIMLLLSTILGFCCLIFVQAHGARLGTYSHSLIQFLFTGVYGSFLTGDFFNLFVFFEILLTSSYVLLLGGSGVSRIRAGLQYVVINLFASSCFLIGLAVIYGVSGTLMIADIAAKLTEFPPADRFLFRIGIAFIGIAFLVKVAIWPFCFWLPAAYSVAAAPVAALFVILSKVGLYAILRIGFLFLGPHSGDLYGFGYLFLFYSGLITLAFGLIGMLANQNLPQLISYCVLASSGTILATIGTGYPALLSVTFYYIFSSTFALAAFFLLAELILRGQDSAANVFAVTMEVYGDDEIEEEIEVGLYIPATIAILGICFTLCAILVIGMPPLSGFIAKFMMLAGIFWPNGMDQPASLPDAHRIAYLIMMILAGFLSLIAMIRVGIRNFWAPIDKIVPKVRIIEIVPIILFLVLCLGLTIYAGPIMHYFDRIAADLYHPSHYIHTILGDEPQILKGT